MTEIKKKKTSLKKKILWGGLVTIVILALIYIFVATEKFSDTKDRKSAYTVNALEFIREFHQNDSAANLKYTDKIIAVAGRVSAIESADTTLNIKFVDPGTGSYAIFAFQLQHLAEAKTVQVGDSITIKGSCSGGVYSEILGVESITFKRSALDKK